MSDDRFTIECYKIAEFPKLRADSDWKSYWRNVSEEGIVTEVSFFYENCTNTSDQIGQTLDVTLHDPDSTESGKVNL